VVNPMGLGHRELNSQGVAQCLCGAEGPDRSASTHSDANEEDKGLRWRSLPAVWPRWQPRRPDLHEIPFWRCLGNDSRV